MQVQPNSGTDKATTDDNIKRDPDIMGLVEVQTANLSGRALDWAVAVAMGWQLVFVTFTCSSTRSSTPIPAWAQGYINDCTHGTYWIDHKTEMVHDAYMPGMTGGEPFEDPFEPTTDWRDTGPLIEEFMLDVLDMLDGTWWAGGKHGGGESTKPQEAICRAAVNTKLGETIRVPAVLLQEAPNA